MQIFRSASFLCTSPNWIGAIAAFFFVVVLFGEFKELALAPVVGKVPSINVESNSHLSEVSSRINPWEKFNQFEWHEGPVPSADSDGAESIFYPGLKMKMSLFERFTTSFWSITFPFQTPLSYSLKLAFVKNYAAPVIVLHFRTYRMVGEVNIHPAAYTQDYLTVS